MFSKYLTKSERLECIKEGALARAEQLDAELGPLEKSALSPGETLKGGADALKTIWVLAAAGAGIPLGVFSHIMGRRVAGKKLREDELKARIKLYRMASEEMASGLGEGS